MPTAVITGITGQDGAYLARNLLARGYHVVGAYRRTGSLNFWRIEEMGIQRHERLTLVEFDLLDMGSCIRLLEKYEPDYFYNLAAQSFVGVSFGQPVTTSQITGIGVLHCLEAIRSVNTKIRFYQASSSELYGKVVETPQSETTPFYPRSPYAVAKLYAHWMTVNYREAYGIFGVSGILFNHESPLRGREFVTRKISNAAAAIRLGKESLLELGNLDAQRDWGYADEYAEGIRLMTEETDVADTFVLATGVTQSVRHFVDLSFKAAGMPLSWKGKGIDEVGIDGKGVTRVRVNPEFYRPAEVDQLTGNAAKMREQLGWQPKTSLQDLATMMVEADLRRNERGVSF
ncbi:MAG TPA: GDP-mannose 4,6-dehydratase [Hyphomonadaceae bacterium]|nr:GDP-mannose 4,6-dehydratase [Hyphomonadaceae bacterium]